MKVGGLGSRESGGGGGVMTHASAACRGARCSRCRGWGLKGRLVLCTRRPSRLSMITDSTRLFFTSRWKAEYGMSWAARGRHVAADTRSEHDHDDDPKQDVFVNRQRLSSFDVRPFGAQTNKLPPSETAMASKYISGCVDRGEIFFLCQGLPTSHTCEASRADCTSSRSPPLNT